MTAAQTHLTKLREREKELEGQVTQIKASVNRPDILPAYYFRVEALRLTRALISAMEYICHIAPLVPPFTHRKTLADMCEILGEEK